MKFTYHFLQQNIRQKLLVFSFRFKDAITVVLDLIVFSRIASILISRQLSDWCIWIKWMELGAVFLEIAKLKMKRKFNTIAPW